MKRWLIFLAFALALPANAMVVKRGPIYAAAPFCGDGVKNGSDACDTADLGGQGCEDLGYASGTLACNVDCTFDFSSCVPSSCSPTGIQFWWRLETQDFTSTNGTDDYSAGDVTAALTGGSIAIDSTQAKMGTNGLKIPGTSGSHASFAVVSDDIVSDAAGRMGFWFRYKTGAWNASGNRVVTIFGDASNQIRVQTMSTEGWLELTYRGDAGGAGGNTTVQTSGAVLTADTWHFVELVWDATASAGADTLELYVDNSLVAGDTARTLNNWNITSATAVNFGDYIGGIQFSDETYYDLVIISNDTAKDVYVCKDTVAYP